MKQSRTKPVLRPHGWLMARKVTINKQTNVTKFEADTDKAGYETSWLALGSQCDKQNIIFLCPSLVDTSNKVKSFEDKN